MTTKGWMFAALVAGGAAFAARGCTGCLSGGGGAPDAKLGAQFDELCAIAKVGEKDAVKGVRKMGGYLVAHGGDMLKNFGDTLGVIESIPDDKKHDERAHRAAETMLVPLLDCADTWEGFADAIEASPEASALVNRAMERLDRTLQIIFQGQSTFTFRGLPAQLGRALDATVK